MQRSTGSTAVSIFIFDRRRRGNTAGQVSKRS
jgi:hypothetical protein